MIVLGEDDPAARGIRGLDQRVGVDRPDRVTISSEVPPGAPPARSSVLGVVEDSGPLRHEPLAMTWVGREQPANGTLDVLVVPAQRSPRRSLCQGAHATTATWLSIRLNRSSHDLTKFRAPSDWSVAASASTSTPADSNCANVASASPPSAAIGSPTRPWSSKARSVDSGIVLIVCGARRPSMYIVSGESGSLV